MHNIDPIQLLIQFINKESITPNEAGTHAIINKLLTKHRFQVIHFNKENVSNIYARFGKQSPHICFAGHTDVVPAGDLSKWITSPFTATIKNGNIYGRGAADMKGGLSACLSAACNFIQKYPDFAGSISFLITSDEEGAAIHGTAYVIQQLKLIQESIDYCIVAEPSSKDELGDTIKNGRRGSLTGFLKVNGKQGHIAYPHLADNPIHKAIQLLHDLINNKWDNGNEFFEPTRLQIANIYSDGGANNVIPEDLKAVFNLRYSTQTTAKDIQHKIHELFNNHNINYHIDWKLSGEPFITHDSKFLNLVSNSVEQLLSRKPHLSTDGGTSDGRFIATLDDCQVVELGLINKTIHQANEHAAICDVNNLTQIYIQILTNLFINKCSKI